MKRILWILSCSCLLCSTFFSSPSPSGEMYEYPHSARYDIGCVTCHFERYPNLPPDWAAFIPVDGDDSLLNHLCRNCHNDIVAPFVRTHSSLTTDQRYGNWTFECRICHNPHIQEQRFTYGNSSFLFQGTISSLSDNVLGCAGAGWTDNQFQNMVVYPNVPQWPGQSYKVLWNSADTLHIDGPMDMTRTATGRSFAVIDGQLVKGVVSTPYNGNAGVKYFRALGANSFSDGDDTYDGICEVCHTVTNHYRNNGSPDHSHKQGVKCTSCHRHKMGFKMGGGGAHPPHDRLVSCDSGNLGCHGANEPPLLADGQSLTGTAKCNNCHTAAGAPTAKSFWNGYGTPGNWISVAGEVSFCVSCHNSTAGYTQMNGGGDAAPNIRGDDSTYGYGVTGHGKPTGNYPRLSWQSTTATGNPAANRLCSVCHDLAAGHFNTSDKRLRAGFENDNTSTNCRQCHNPGTSAVAAPPWYTTYSEYQASAHGALKCTECHDAHGKAGAYAGMAKGNKQNLCLTCHAGMAGHALGVAFGRGGSSYSLECVTCHNVHIVTGMFSATDGSRTPMTRIDNNLALWGVEAGQKMNDFAGSGTYRTPTGDTLTGAQLPSYPTFCLQCHGQNMSPSIHGNIGWGDAHGLGSANSPNGGGLCPDWGVCGMGAGWDGDDCAGGDNVCWPVIPRGRGDELFSRDAYSHEQRIAGINFVLSCNDCHVTHESGIGRKIRSTVNGNPGSTIYNTMCNACHYYYSDWHAGMSCGGSCHWADVNPRFGGPYNTIHGMSKASGDGSTRIFDNSLVVDMRFEGNLDDSGTWRMHGRWPGPMSSPAWGTAGTYVAGRFGNAIQVMDQPVEVGTRNGYWSTDEGKHGTWKYTEMKYKMTLEAWVYPTDANGTERRVLAKSWYYDGGYALVLRNVNGKWRAGLLAKTNGVRNDYRGAYSTVSVPLNEWTHIAATYDNTGLDRNPGDGSVGRIRIYVNGEDVTMSDTSGSYVQPGAGENAMYPYSMHNAAPAGICYDDTWCASPLSVGGVNWSDNGANFIGRIDEVKVWNVTKNAAYFEAFDSLIAPRIDRVEGVVGSNTLSVTFSEGVYTGTGGVGALQVSDFNLTDADNGRTITGVTHTAGASTATLALGSALDSANDIGTDTLAAAVNAIYDEYDNPAPTTPVTITASSTCPTGQVVFNLDEPAGGNFVLDDSQLLYGAVNDPSDTMGGGVFFGDNINNYISFQSNTSCMKATTALTLEARIKPTAMAGTANYITRIFAKDTSSNYQMSVWRNNTTFAPNYNAPSGTASIAFWVAVDNAHGGNAWKPVLTDYTLCPIVSDHWYVVKTVWDSNKPGGVPGQKFVPANVFIEDQGTDGSGAGKNWTGSVDCTKADQSYLPDTSAFYTGDTIKASDGIFAIGCAAGTLGNNRFVGSMDWIKWYGLPGQPQGAPTRWEWDMDLYIVPPSP